MSDQCFPPLQEAAEADLKNQLSLMTSRVQDLTTKLAASQRKVTKLEKKTTSATRGKPRRNSREITDKEKVTEGKEVDTTDVLNASSTGEETRPEEHGSDSEKSTFSDPEVVHRLRKLQGELEISKEKVQELQIKDSELKSLQSTAQQLREQNKMYKEQIAYMQAKLQSAAGDKDKDSSNVPGKLKEVEHRLNQSESLLKDCRDKLSGVINELGSFGIIPTRDNYSSTIESLRDRLREILKEVEDVSKRTEESKKEALKGDVHLDLDSTVRIFAEKLSLEALVIGEMASLLRSSQNDVINERENHLCEIQFANKHILDLEQKIDFLQASNNNTDNPNLEKTKSSLQAYSDLLSERMVVHAQILASLENNKYGEETDKDTSSSQVFASQIAREALFRSKLDLPIYSTSTVKENEQALGLASKVLVQGELAFTMNKLRERMSNTMTDQERIDLLEQELELAEHRLRDREKNLAQSVQSFISAKTAQFAEIWLQENHSNETVDSPEKELEEMLQKHAELFEKQINPKVNTSDVKRHERIVESVSTASEYVIHKLTTSVEEELRKQSVASSKKTKYRLSAMEVLENLAEVVANKAVISGQISYLKEQLEIRSNNRHSPRSPSANGKGGSRPGSAHAHSNRGSGSASGYGGDGGSAGCSQESGEVAERLTQEAGVRQRLVGLLLGALERGGPGAGAGGAAALEADPAVRHVASLARRLVQLDTALIRPRHSLQDYAEMVTREALFQVKYCPMRGKKWETFTFGPNSYLLSASFQVCRKNAAAHRTLL